MNSTLNVLNCFVVRKNLKGPAAQLKTKQLLGEHELIRKMTEELQYEKGFKQAQMEEEKVIVRSEVYKKTEEQNEIGSVEKEDSMDNVSMELASSASGESEPSDLNKRPIWNDEKSNVVLQPIPFTSWP